MKETEPKRTSERQKIIASKETPKHIGKSKEAMTIIIMTNWLHVLHNGGDENVR
jgi:hypothetical protein